MNLVDNGITKIIEVSEVENGYGWDVIFVDWYSNVQTRNFLNIDDLENKKWKE